MSWTCLMCSCDTADDYDRCAGCGDSKLATRAVAETREKVRRQAEQLTIQRLALEERNRALDAMHWVWCSGSCAGGVHRWGERLTELTPELVELAERNARRLRAKLANTGRGPATRDLPETHPTFVLGVVSFIRNAFRNDGAEGESVHKLCDIAEALLRERDTPELHDFTAAVVLEAQHQRARWGAAHDAGKAPEDWFWLLGYLAGKALHAAKTGDRDKAMHHTISSAAALANWHAALLGANAKMRPGIEPPPEVAQ